MRKLIIIALFVLSTSIPYAAAHPFIIDSSPNSASNAPVGTTKIIAHFSEPVELNFSFLKVIDSNGEQIDNKDSKYFDGENSLIVTTPPLEEGVYTVTTKTLSKIDGHLVPGAFIFAVGDAKIDVGSSNNQNEELVFLPEAGARFPGLVGETIVLGVLIASIAIWGTQNKQLVRKEIEKLENFHHGKFMKITGIGLLLVFASNILMLAIQTIRLETSVISVIQTNFGNVWVIRMTLTVILLGLWFGMDRKKRLSLKNKIPMLVVTLGLIGTSSMIGHGAASGETPAFILDYIHNFVAAVWIGGIIYFVFTLLPTFSQLEETKREKMTLVLIPRFSIVFIIAVGIVIITGPTLMWFLESNVGLITESIYGKLIFAKIAIAAIMVAIGGYFQFKIQKKAEKDLRIGSIIAIHKKLGRSLKFDVILGIVLLGVVALLTNGTLPAGEIKQVDAQKISYDFHTVEFSEKTKFDVKITPFSSGTNTIFIKISDFENNPLSDSDQIKVKISNPQRNIAPIEVPMKIFKQEKNKPIEFQGEITFGFSGQWQVEIETQRKENANETILMNLLVKPRLDDLKTEIIEYQLPESSKPLYPLYDGKDSIWVSDPSAPKLWKFSLDTKNFTSYSFDGLTTILLTKDNEGKIWFTDTPRNQIGYFDPSNQTIKTKSLPKLAPVINDNTPTFVQADFDGNIWISITNKDTILKYYPQSDTFEEIKMPVRGSLPFALTIDNEGKIWFTESATGKIGFINPKDNKISEFTPENPLASPEALAFDKEGNLWIAEHTGTAVTKFNPILETFETVKVPDKDALPYGMSFDRYGNIWIAQHTVDKIVAYDPDNKNLIEVPVPTTTSFVQFLTSDDKDNVWFVEQQGNKLGMIKTTEIPRTVSEIQNTNNFQLKYSEIVSPLIAMGIIATSLFFVRNLKDKRRLNELIMSG
ncbi:MAG TPA: CopD family protein [Nitrosarchaeum sp.]|nr:CopD family protein [Nitrosarchaeum sp.]